MNKIAITIFLIAIILLIAKTNPYEPKECFIDDTTGVCVPFRNDMQRDLYRSQK